MQKLFLSCILFLASCLPSSFYAQALSFTVSSSSVCLNQSIIAGIASAPPGANGYAWAVSPPGPLGTPGTTESFTFSSCGNHTITCVALAGTTPVGTYSLVIPVNCASVSVVPPTQTICAGGIGSVTAAYSWTNTVDSFTFMPASSTSYTITNSGGPCVAIVTVNVANPVIIASSNSVCAGFSSTLTAFGASNYTWTGSSLSLPVAQPSLSVGAGTYTVSAMASNGSCSSSIAIGTSPPLTLNVTLSSATTCITNNDPTYSKPVTINASGASAYAIYPFNNGTGSGPPFTERPAASTCYTIIGSTSTCSGSAVSCVTVMPQYTIAITPASPTICIGSSTSLSITGIGQPNYGAAFTYSWTDPSMTGPTISENSGTASVMAFPPGNAVYTVQVKDSQQCASFSQTVGVSVMVCTGIQANGSQSAGFVFYPNPFQEQLFIGGSTAGDLFIEMKDLYSKTVLDQKLAPGKMPVMPSGLLPGIYFARIRQENTNTGWQKVVKENR